LEYQVKLLFNEEKTAKNAPSLFSEFEWRD